MTEQEWLTSTDPQRMLQLLNPRNAKHLPKGSPFWTTQVSDRQLRLFACACCRMVWDRLTDDRSRRAVEVAERYADGLETRKEVIQHCGRMISENMGRHYQYPGSDPEWIAVWAVNDESNLLLNASHYLQRVTQLGVPTTVQADLLRSIVGNPFRPVMLCPHRLEDRPGGDRVHVFECPDPDEGYHSPNCVLRNPTVRQLAEVAYQERGRRRCDDRWTDDFGDYFPDHPKHCRCCGTGTLDTGELDEARLAVLADAAEEAGCCEEEILRPLRGEERVCRKCERCGGSKKVRPAGWDDGRGGRDYSAWTDCSDCGSTGYLAPEWVPVRRPRWRGFWCLDLLTGRR